LLDDEVVVVCVLTVWLISKIGDSIHRAFIDLLRSVSDMAELDEDAIC
jgi:hypothetical protein